MKKVFYLFSIVFLMQSCFSYKKIENNSSQYEIGKTYRVYQDKKKSIINIKSKTDSTLIVISKFEEHKFPINSISKVDKRKFSIVKTLLLPVSIVSSIIVLFALTY
jgi:hypothetical protein